MRSKLSLERVADCKICFTQSDAEGCGSNRIMALIALCLIRFPPKAIRLELCRLATNVLVEKAAPLAGF